MNIRTYFSVLHHVSIRCQHIGVDIQCKVCQISTFHGFAKD